MFKNAKTVSSINKLRFAFVITYIACTIMVWNNSDKTMSIKYIMLTIILSALIAVILYLLRNYYNKYNLVRLILVAITIVLYVMLYILFHGFLFNILFCMTVVLALLIASSFIDLELE